MIDNKKILLKKLFILYNFINNYIFLKLILINKYIKN